MLQVGIIGYDHAHLPKYVPALATHPRARLSVVAAIGVNRPLARRHAETYRCRYTERLEEFWQGDPVDAVYIGTEPSRHLEIIREVAPRGIHILCDKPLATTLEDADAILACVAEHQAKLMVPFNPRGQLAVIRLKEMIDSGEFGDVHCIHATKYGKIPRGIPDLDTSWFFDPQKAGFGGFGDIGIHAVDALRWLTGSEVRRVYARIDRTVHQDIAVDDIGTAVIDFENGTVATLASGWVNPQGNPVWLNVAFEVTGTKKTALIDKPYHDFTIADETRFEAVPWWRTDIPRLVDGFITAIEEDREPPITGRDARAALEIVLAAYHSAGSGEPVDLPLK